MPDTTLVLGGITFADIEIPPRIGYGGDQMLGVHKLVGGARVLDAMGPDDRAIQWSGLFRGQTAVARAQSVDALRRGGAQQTLTWSGFNYTVVVKSFLADFQRFYQIPYQISCEVVADNTQPVTSSSTPSVDQQLQADALAAVAAATDLANAEVNLALQNMLSAVQAVQSFLTAPQSTINSVLGSANTAQTAIGAAIATTNTAIGTPTTFGGVVAGAAPSASVAALTAQTTNVSNLSTLYQTQSIVGRIQANLASVYGSPNTITVAGGNLYAIAQSVYGDATAWTTIANANDLTDPFVQGAPTLIVPAQSDQSGGILAA